MVADDALCLPYLALDEGFDGVAVSTLGRASGGETLAATDHVAARLDEIQLDLGEGPAWEALRRRRALVAPEPVGSDHTEWPLFRAASEGLDAGTIFAVPLLFADVAIGVVELYRSDRGDVSPATVASAIAQSRVTFFDVLARSVHDARADLSENPRSRRVVHQATGMIVGRYRIPADDALTLLRARAFALGRTVVDVAEEIVRRRAPLLEPGNPSKDPL